MDPLASLVPRVPHACVLVAEAKSGMIRSVNEHLCRLLSYKCDQLVGANVKLLMDPAYAEEYDTYAKIHLSAGIKTVSLLLPWCAFIITQHTRNRR